MIETELDAGCAEGFGKFIRSGAMDKLVLLDIAGNNIDAEAFSNICDAVIDNKIPLALEELWVGGCCIMDLGIGMLTSLIINGFLPRLSTLCIDSTFWGIE